MTWVKAGRLGGIQPCKATGNEDDHDFVLEIGLMNHDSIIVCESEKGINDQSRQCC